MMNTEIKFPIMDMTEFLFESERVFFSYLEFEREYTFKKKYVKKLSKWKYIDAEGKQLQVKIIKQEELKNMFSFLFGKTYNLELELYHTGKSYDLEFLKREILKKKDKMFHIYHNKLITLTDYEQKMEKAESFLTLIDIASFEDYKEN